MKRQRNLLIGLAAAILLLLGGVAYWRLRPARQAAEPAPAEPVVSVRLAHAQRGTIASEVSAVGTIFPRAQATVSASVGGRIRQMRVLRNVSVRERETLAQLDDRDLRAQRAEAVAALQEARLAARGVSGGAIPQANALAERDLRDARANATNARALYERRSALYAQGGLALKDVEAARLTLTQAENSLRLAERTIALRQSAINPNDRAVAVSRVGQAEQRVATLDAQIALTTIRAPISGVVTDQFQFEGEYAASGGRLDVIADTSEMIIKAPFADTVAARLRTGDPATVSLNDPPGERLKARVSLVSRATDPLNRTVEVWVTLRGGAARSQTTLVRLRPGGSADVTVTDRRANEAIVVPASAVTLDAPNADAGTVMVVDAARVAHETKVRVGIRANNRVQVVSGLRAGDTVVIEGNYALPDGTKVQAASGDAVASPGGTP